MELRCGSGLAIRLGAVLPQDLAHYRALRAAGHLLVRDPISGTALFWPWLLSPTQKLANDVFGRVERKDKPR